jgi:hypothetical protein
MYNGKQRAKFNVQGDLYDIQLLTKDDEEKSTFLFTSTKGLYVASITKKKTGRLARFMIDVDYDQSYFEDKHVRCVA